MKKLFSKNESGRSMVEMLGVLAIIGVLSVGGIAGHRIQKLKRFVMRFPVSPFLFMVRVNKMFYAKSLNEN